MWKLYPNFEKVCVERPIVFFIIRERERVCGYFGKSKRFKKTIGIIFLIVTELRKY